MERAARNHYQTRGSTRGVGGTTVERDLLLQWGNRKRLRCVKGQRRDFDAAATAAAEKAAVGQRRAAAAAAAAHHHHRALSRNSEESAAMTSSAQQQQQNNVIHTVASLNRECQVRASNNHHHNGASPASPDDKKGASSGSEGSVWPKFEIGLTNKEKEEDFLVLKGSKLPQRPKKRAKVIQRTINLVCPGTWLCDLTLERYEVREKKVSKKRPRGLKSMQNLESDSD